jgi:hypothetical protein
VNDLAPFFDQLAVLLTVLAGPYRVVAYKFRSFSGIGHGLLTWIGIGLVFPVCTGFFSRPDTWWVAWVALAVCGYVQMFVKWCRTAPRLDPASPQCWFGNAELFFVVALVYAANLVCGPGGAAFFLAGYACSTAQWMLRRLASRPSRDTEWPHASARTTAAGMAYGPAQGYYPRPPSFGSRVASYLAGHMLFSIITGAIGFWGILKAFGMILTIPAAVLIWMLGGKADLPEFAKHDARSFFSRVADSLRDKKDDVMEKLHLKREAMEESPHQQRQQPTGGPAHPQGRTAGYGFSRNAHLPDPPQRADAPAVRREAILDAAAADLRERLSLRNSPARPADAPAGAGAPGAADAHLWNTPVRDAHNPNLWNIPAPPPRAAAPDLSPRPSLRNSPAPPADPPAGGDPLRAAGLRALADGAYIEVTPDEKEVP